jgi:hypothetical protein
MGGWLKLKLTGWEISSTFCSRGQVVVPGAEAEEISQPGARERNEALQDEGGQIIRGLPTGTVDDGPASEDSDSDNNHDDELNMVDYAPY